MQKISDKELKNIVGGFSLTSKIFLIGGIVSFIIGLIDGQIKLK